VQGDEREDKTLFDVAKVVSKGQGYAIVAKCNSSKVEKPAKTNRLSKKQLCPEDEENPDLSMSDADRWDRKDPIRHNI